MAYFIHARDGAGLVVLRRESREAAEKKAAELREAGCFEVSIVEQAQISPAPTERNPPTPVEAKTAI